MSSLRKLELRTAHVGAVWEWIKRNTFESVEGWISGELEVDYGAVSSRVGGGVSTSQIIYPIYPTNCPSRIPPRSLAVSRARWLFVRSIDTS